MQKNWTKLIPVDDADQEVLTVLGNHFDRRRKMKKSRIGFVNKLQF